MLASTILVAFAIGVLFIVGGGAWLMWAEFNLTHKRNEYTRYKWHNTQHLPNSHQHVLAWAQ